MCASVLKKSIDPFFVCLFVFKSFSFLLQYVCLLLSIIINLNYFDVALVCFLHAVFN